MREDRYMEHKAGTTQVFYILPFPFRGLSPWGRLIQLFIISPLQRLQQTRIFTMDCESYKAMLHSGKSLISYGCRSNTSILLSKKEKKVCLHSITNLMISFWSLWSISSQSCDYQKVPASTLKSHHLVSLPIKNSIIL